jgi:hypothetical protein
MKNTEDWFIIYGYFWSCVYSFASIVLRLLSCVFYEKFNKLKFIKFFSLAII